MSDNILVAPSRRTVFKLLGPAVAGGSLAACNLFQTGTTSGTGTVTPPSTLPTWVTDVENIVTDIAGVVAPASVQSLIATLITAGNNVVAAYNSGGTVSALMSAFESAFDAVISGLGGTSILGNFGTLGTILQMGLQLLPTILAAVGVAGRYRYKGTSQDLRAIAAARAYLASLAGR